MEEFQMGYDNSYQLSDINFDSNGRERQVGRRTEHT